MSSNINYKFVVEEIKESTIISSQDEQEVNHDVEIKMRQSGKAKKKMRNVHLYDKIFENVLIEGKELDCTILLYNIRKC